MRNDELLRLGRLSRRQVMRMFAASAVLVGCSDDSATTETTSSAGGAGGASGTGGSPGAGGAGGDAAGAGGAGAAGEGGAGGAGDPFAVCKQRGPTEGCFITEDNILGPFYKPGAPLDSDLADDLPGQLMRIEGTVYGCDCETPLVGAIVDIWQADDEGGYDAAGFTLRGRIETDQDGRYSLITIKPGWYLNGAQFRPAHIHYKVSHGQGLALTTQLYFEGDPYIPDDPFVKDSLVIPLSNGQVKGRSGLVGTFDIVLA